MDDRTREALTASIEHWKRLVACKHPADFRREGYGMRECALCTLFFNQKEAGTCEGCPVYEVTGLPGCSDTPYVRADRLMDGYSYVGDITEPPTEVCQEELEFLESLL